MSDRDHNPDDDVVTRPLTQEEVQVLRQLLASALAWKVST